MENGRVFKVGDKVRFIHADKEGDPRTKNGQIGVVTKLMNNFTSYKVEGTPGTITVFNHRLELVVEEVKPMPKLLDNGFYVGDKVKYNSVGKWKYGIVMDQPENAALPHPDKVWGNWDGKNIPTYVMRKEAVLVERVDGVNEAPVPEVAVNGMKTFVYYRRRKVIGGVGTGIWKIKRPFKNQVYFMRCLNAWNLGGGGFYYYTDQDKDFHVNVKDAAVGVIIEEVEV